MPSSAPKEPAALTFTFKNVGPIDTAELELGDLTIIAGRNNTGKTYLVYTLYGFLKTWESWLPSSPQLPGTKPRASDTSRAPGQYPTFEQISEQVAENGHAEFSVDSGALNRERTEAMKVLTRRFSERGIAEVFSSSSEKFEGASIGVKLDMEFPCSNQPVETFAETEDKPSIRYDGGLVSRICG